jgi:hypothetical protein
VSNFREKLDELNEQVAKFDDLQVQVEETEASLAIAKDDRDRALDSVHAIVRELNGMLPSRPEEEAPPPLTASSNW